MSNINKEIISIVDSLPSDGEWWRRDGRDTYIKVAKKLHRNNIDILLIREVLESLYYATSAEYGN